MFTFSRFFNKRGSWMWACSALLDVHQCTARFAGPSGNTILVIGQFTKTTEGAQPYCFYMINKKVERYMKG